LSDEVSEEVGRGELTPDEAKSILLAAARRRMQRLDRHDTFDRQGREPEPPSGERADRIVGAVYRLRAEQGRTAVLSPRDVSFLGPGPQTGSGPIVHHPSYACGIGHMKHIALREAAELDAVLRRHPRVERLVTGHHHRPIQVRVRGAIAQVAPSVAHQVALLLRP
jgi:hypothetical protein